VTLFRNIGRLLSRGHLQETVWGRKRRPRDAHRGHARQPGPQEARPAPESGYRVVPIYNYGYRLEKITPP
jgi:DNA-binding response OmpR family regulator